VVGDKEVEEGTVSLRRRGQGNLGTRPPVELRDELVAEAASRRL
jgi:threonyl-tRNA synthetase